MATTAALVDYFLTVDGLPGESVDVQHKGAFEIKEFSFEIENKTTIGSATGGAGAGKIKFDEFQIKKTTDKASPIFFRNCAAGTHYKTVVLSVRKAGGDPSSAGNDFLKVTFSDVLTSRYVNTASSSPPPQPPPVEVITAPVDVIQLPPGQIIGPELPEDSIAFNYAKVQFVTNATRLSVPPAAGAMLSFDAATNTLKITDAPGGVFTVGTQGGTVSYSITEYNVLASLVDLIKSVLPTASAKLMVSEVREAATPPPPVDTTNVGPGSSALAPQPVLHFDVLFYTPADGVLTLEDLTRPGKRIGTLTVDPRGAPASLDIDLTETLVQGNLNSFGIRLQLRGAPIPGLTGGGDEGPEERDFEPNRNASASFTLEFVVDVAGQ